jgi:chemotaxis protein MotB
MAKLGRGRRLKSGGAPASGWEVIYTGFILIMLCFFIMLCAFSKVQKSKVEHFVASFNRAVSVLPGGVKVRPGDEPRQSTLEIAKDQGEMALIFQELQKALGEQVLQDEFSFVFLRNGMMVRLADKALFDLGVAKISNEAIPILDKIGKIISDGDFSVQINGHTDNIPIHTHEFPSNWELSTERAVNVLRYFVEMLGVSPDRLSAAGFGEFHPIVPNTDPKLRHKNRRVEIIFKLKKKSGSTSHPGPEDGSI